MRRAILLAGAVVLWAAADCQVLGGPVYEPGYVVQYWQKFLNTTVTTQGTVIDSQVVAAQPPDNTRGRYVVQGSDGKSIIVLTTKEPPPNRKQVRVTGVVTISPTEPAPGVILRERAQFPVLWVALGALVVLAVVLVVLLVRRPTPPPRECTQCGAPVPEDARHCPACGKEQGREGPDDGGGVRRVTPEPTAPARRCVECDAVLPSDADYCDQCGAKARGEDEERETVVFKGTLEVVSGPDVKPGDVHVLTEPRHKIGHQRDLLGKGGICLPDKTVSREHALLSWRDGAYSLQDLDSTMGTLVNGAPITKHVLEDGDEIRVGATTLRFKRSGASGSEPPAR